MAVDGYPTRADLTRDSLRQVGFYGTDSASHDVPRSLDDLGRTDP
jgi:hypothetical protein